MKKDYLSRLNTNHYLTRFFAVLVAVCLSAFGLQAQSDATVIITAPAGSEGSIAAIQSAFGPGITADVSGPVLEAVDTSGAPLGCSAIAADLTGAIALVDRGVCGFAVKALNAQAAGAIGVIVCNLEIEAASGVDQRYKAITMGGDDMGALTIPAVMIPYEQCAAMRVNVGNGLEVTLSSGVLPVAAGETCDAAIEIGPGTHSVAPLINGYGGRLLFASVSNAAWYSYTPAENTVATVSSCNLATADTRLYILAGTDCSFADLAIVATNDDCDPDNGNFASEVSFIAAKGVRYWIFWDDRWDYSGFDFELSEDASALPDINVTFSVDMKYETTSPDGVSMVYAGPGATGLGDVSILALDDSDGDGVWVGTAAITALDTIGYAFVNGDVLMNGVVESVPGDCGLDGGFGFNVRPYIVGAADATLQVVCFSSCTSCEVTDCDEPAILIADNIDGLTAGNAFGQTPWWGAWPGTTVSGEVTTEQFQSGTQSIKIAGTIANQDALLNFGDRTEGHYLIRWDMYVPAGNNAYFNLQHLAPTASAGFWGFECYFENGVGRLELYDGSDPVAFSFPSGAWFPVYIFVDLDNDEARMIVNEFFVDAWQFSTGASVAAAVNQLNSINFYPANTTHLFYIDDVDFWEIPAAGDGLYCHTATEITPGPQNFSGLECFGGGHDLRNPLTTALGLRAAWYQYTATEDGIISVASCGGAADSRVWVFEGECHDLKLVGINDDRCEQANADPYASYREVVVTAGSTYYIMWDNVWDPTGTDWELAFEAVEPAEGLFCQSATVIDPGIYTVTEFGDAAVAGPNVNTFVASTTPYAGSAWYSYTPEADGTVTISSCTAGTDTRVWVYTGTCDNFSTLTLVASDGDGCGLSSIIEGLEVTAGTTYYIEWDDEESADPFDWELSYMEPAVTVTFNVDMSKVEEWGSVSPEGVHIAGSFQGWDPAATLMTDNGDGTWSYTTTLPPNTEVQYKFLNGNAWGTDEVNITADCGIDGGSGSFNRLLVVGEDDLATPFYCFDFCVTCDLVSTSEEALKTGVKVFPNPARELLNVSIELPEAAENLSIRMVNALGQVVYQRYLGSLQNDNIEIGLASMPAGAYMLQVVDGKAQFTQSVIVQK